MIQLDAMDSGDNFEKKSSFSTLDDLQLCNYAKSLCEIVEVKDRYHKLKKIKDCFVGREAVERMVSEMNISKDEAVELGNKLFDKGLFVHVTNDHYFMDEKLYFRFVPHVKERMIQRVMNDYISLNSNGNYSDNNNNNGSSGGGIAGSNNFGSSNSLKNLIDLDIGNVSIASKGSSSSLSSANSPLPRRVNSSVFPINEDSSKKIILNKSNSFPKLQPAAEPDELSKEDQPPASSEVSNDEQK